MNVWRSATARTASAFVTSHRRRARSRFLTAPIACSESYNERPLIVQGLTVDNNRICFDLTLAYLDKGKDAFCLDTHTGRLYGGE